MTLPGRAGRIEANARRLRAMTAAADVGPRIGTGFKKGVRPVSKFEFALWPVALLAYTAQS